MEYRNAVFVVTSEDSCPIYNVGEEIQIQDSAVSVDYEKPVCLILVRELHKALAKKLQLNLPKGCTAIMRGL